MIMRNPLFLAGALLSLSVVLLSAAVVLASCRSGTTGSRMLTDEAPPPETYLNLDQPSAFPAEPAYAGPDGEHRSMLEDDRHGPDAAKGHPASAEPQPMTVEPAPSEGD
jgi:hypothetical protein